MNEIIKTIFNCLLVGGLFALLIVLIWFYFSIVDKDTKLKNDYIDTLDEHDKSVVMTYLNTKYHPFGKKKDKSNIEKLIDEEIEKEKNK